MRDRVINLYIHGCKFLYKAKNGNLETKLLTFLECLFGQSWLYQRIMDEVERAYRSKVNRNNRVDFGNDEGSWIFKK